MSKRGFAAIGLWHPKFDGNAGGSIRAARAFDAKLVAIIGSRLSSHARGRIERTDPRSSHRHMPVLFCDSVKPAIPHEAVPIAVELVDGAEPLPEFEHPEAAFYLFGPEDGSLPRMALEQCHRYVAIPTSRCLNLSAAVNVLLYDRAAKQQVEQAND